MLKITKRYLSCALFCLSLSAMGQIDNTTTNSSDDELERMIERELGNILDTLYHRQGDNMEVEFGDERKLSAHEEKATNHNSKVQNNLAPQRILLFGDSMLDGVGRRFQDYADENGHTLFTSIWYGSTTHNWAKTQDLRDLIRKVNPTFVIVSLGTNDLGYHDLAARSESVRQILSVIGDTPFIWIGPAKLPRLNKDFGIVGMLKETIGEDCFYDSYNERLARLADHVHPTFAASATWVDKVVRWMNRADAPCHIRMEWPQKKSTFRNYETHSPRYKGKGGGNYQK